MKKSLLNIVTVALVVINLVLSVVIIFSILPASRKTDKMITQICTALSLELESKTTGTGEQESELSIDQLETYAISEEMTVTLKKGPDGKDHYAVVIVSIVVDNKHKDYKKYVESITTKEDLIKDVIGSTMGDFTAEEVQDDTEKVQEAILKKLQSLFNSDFIVKVAFSKKVVQ